MAPDRFHRFNESDVMEEIARILSDARRYLAEDPSREVGALLRAQHDSTRRSLARAGAGPESLAALLAHWVVTRADRATFAESLDAGLAAAEGRDAADPLTRDLDQFARDYLGGQISGEEFVRRLKKPRATAARRTRRRRERVPAGAITVSRAQTTLEGMIAEARVERRRPNPRTTWDVFKAFAARRVVADPPGKLDSDLGLFQWGVYDWEDGKGARFELNFTRQFALSDEDGDYDHMEQLACTLYFEPNERLRGLGRGEVWSSGDVSADDVLRAWIAEVEETGVLAVIAGDHVPIECRVEQEQV